MRQATEEEHTMNTKATDKTRGGSMRINAAKGAVTVDVYSEGTVGCGPFAAVRDAKSEYWRSQSSGSDRFDLSFWADVADLRGRLGSDRAFGSVLAAAFAEVRAEATSYTGATS